MPPKADDKKKSGAVTDPSLCGVPTPGPKYKLKTLVGYKQHCISKDRGPAYSFGLNRFPQPLCRSPGPIYMLPGIKPNGFVHGLPTNIINKTVSPGPKYLPKTPPIRPGYSIKWRTNPRAGLVTPAPYYIKSVFDGPAFKIGLPTPGIRCPAGPGPSVPYTLDAIKPNSPAYSIGLPQPHKPLCRSPGPKYNPQLFDLSPKYSFGVKHSLCSPPMIVECDDRC
ncbi:hypothetical protein KPH14_005490 [Odynerus spinipes]|uniref:Outer dense fiber protein 3 n=1 Tax=Odynerus spinipes TaxID=1348599 RepID=A0AAD9VJF7_9HYME|nr:hypothetical protein KPH14_005490 [Odynerus spinipes]